LAQRLRLDLGMNRITVVADDKAISSQARTYAEYRVFSALTRHAIKFRSARVLLRPSDDRDTCARVTCAVSVVLEPSRSVRVRVTGPHVYAAINRAIERLGDVLGGRIEQRRSS
jgi:ribosome-associated translation inhibitor RaiA